MDNLETTLNEKIHPKLKSIENFIGEKDFLTGTLTIADFFFFEVLNFILAAKPEALSSYSRILKVHDRMANLSGVKEHIASGKL